jgi:UDP-glucose 4-epimerase
MRILITGGAGCLGANLTERWLTQGDDVLVIDNYATGFRDNLPAAHPRLTVIDGSIVDNALLGRAFSDFKPTHVVHSAASYKDPDDWAEDSRINVEGTVNVLKAARAAQIKRFINLQTALAYGRPDQVPIPADHPVRPFTSYGVSKAAGEHFVMMSGLPAVSLRLANVTGPRLAIGPIPTFYKRLKNGQSCFCSRTVRDFVDMEDFFTLMDAVMAENAPTGAFNASTGTGHTIKEIFDLVAAHLGVTRDEPVPEVDPGLDDVPAVVLDPSKTREAFGWSHRYDFKEIIARVLAWYDVHGVSAIYSHLKPPELAGR